MAFRDELGAAQARADALERRVAELEQENEQLRGEDEEPDAPAEAPRPRKSRAIGTVMSVTAVIWLVCGFIGGVVAIIGAVVGLTFLIMGVTMVKLLEVVGPDEMLVVSGRRYANARGESRGYRLVSQGALLAIPLIERVDRMSTRSSRALIDVRGAYTAKSVPVHVAGVATLRVDTTQPNVHNAVERFLGRSLDEISRVGVETIEGTLRQVMAELSIEELQGDRVAFAARVQAEVAEDLAKLGIALDTLSIDSVTRAS